MPNQISMYRKLVVLAKQFASTSGALSLDDSDPDSRFYQDGQIAIEFDGFSDLTILVAFSDGNIEFNGIRFKCVLSGSEDSAPDVYRPDVPLSNEQLWTDYLEEIAEHVPLQASSKVDALDSLAKLTETPLADLKQYIVQLSELHRMGLKLAGWILKLLKRLSESSLDDK